MDEAVKGRLGQELQALSQFIEEATTPYTEKEKVMSKPKDGVTRRAEPGLGLGLKIMSCHSS